MREPVQRTTLSQGAYLAIRRMILTGTLAPGSRVIVATLAAALKLSPTPVNEALAALEREGLVSYAPHRGYSVCVATAESVSEVYEVREPLELLTVRHVARQRDAFTIQRLGAIVAQMREAVRAGDTSAFSDLDLEFHRALWGSARGGLTTRIGEVIGGQLALLVSTTSRASGRLRGAYQEHRAIYEAIAAGKTGAAVAAMRRHVRNARLALEASARGASAPRARSADGASRKRRKPGSRP
jgi:DNA-binding GntR family transcriptional regulator